MSSYRRNVAIVLAGTAAAQVLPLAVLPILTRVVGSNDLGIYFLWLGAASVLTILATARLDMAIFNARSEEAVLDLLRLILIIASVVAVTTVLTGKIGLVRAEWLADKLVVTDFAISLGLFSLLAAINISMLAVLVYRSQFKLLGWAKIVLGASMALLQLVVSLSGGKAEGLVISHLSAMLLTVAVTMRWANALPLKLAKDVSAVRLKNALLSNYRFPMFSLPADFVSTLATQLPLFILVSRFGMTAMASYALTLRVIAGPIGLLANSVLTVYKERAARDFRDQGNCLEAYRQTFKNLTVLAIAPSVVIAFSGEWLFILLFGTDWATAGRYAEILAPMFFLKFIASPLSYTFYVGNRQLDDLLWQSGLWAMTWAAFTLASDIELAVQTYSLGYSVMYLFYLALSYRAARGRSA